jgi:UDP-glucuronate 4-epimerase
MKRDFTYVDDIVTGTIKVLDRPPQGNTAWTGESPDPSSSRAPYKIYNIGNNTPVALMDFIDAIEKSLNRKAEKNFLPMQPGDVPATWANVDDLIEDLGYAPSVPIEEGVKKFVEWYLDFYGGRDE